jgi:hypothetical protein
MSRESESRRAARIALLVLLLALAFSVLVRVRLLDVPLERDEGEYAYMGRLILEGTPPYAEAYNMKLPGIYVVYAGILALFGETIRGIHLGLLAANVLAIVLVFAIARRFLRKLGAAAAAACYAVLSASRGVQGVFANAEHFLLVFVLAGFLVLARPDALRRAGRIFLAGLLLGAGFVVKQHGAAFVLLGFLLVAGATVREKARASHLGARVLAFAAGACVPYALVLFWMAAAGTLRAFRHWTVEYAGAYVSQVPLGEVPGRFLALFGGVAGHAPSIWILAGGGVVSLLLSRARRALVLLAALFFSLAAVSPGFYFRPHYFVLLLPAASLLAGEGMERIERLLGRRFGSGASAGVASLALLLALAFAVHRERAFFFTMTPEEACRSTYGLNPFVESIEIGERVRERTRPDERIAVIGSEPQIYFYADRRAATGFLYMYPLMEAQPFARAMQEQMIAEIERASPAVLVFVRNRHSWAVRPDSETLLLDWFDTYRERHYRLAGLIEQHPERSVHHWGAERPWPPRTSDWIALLERREETRTGFWGSGVPD